MIELTDLMFFDARWTFITRDSDRAIQLRSLLDFEAGLLEEAEGAAWLGYTDPENGAIQWYSAEQARAKLEAIEEGLAAASEYEAFWLCRHVLVFTVPRLLALLDRVESPAVEAHRASLRERLASIPPETHLALFPDFAALGDSLILATMIAVTTGWPDKRHRDPPVQLSAYESGSYPLEAARGILSDVFPKLGTGLAMLLSDAGLGVAQIEIGGHTILPPSVWAARPIGDVEEDPSEYVSGPMQTVVADLARSTIGSYSLADLDLAGGVISEQQEAGFLVLRREIVQESERVIQYPSYLAVADSGTSPASVHRGIWHLADRLGYIHYQQTYYHDYNFHPMLESSHQEVARWQTVANEAHTILDPLLLRLTITRGRPLDILHEALSLIHTTLMQGIGNISQLFATPNYIREVLTEVAEDLQEDFRQRFRESHVGELPALGRSVVEGGWHAQVTQVSENIAATVERTERDYSRIFRVLSMVFEQRRVREVESLEGMSHQLNIVIAGLAAVLGFAAVFQLEIEAVALPFLYMLRGVTLFLATGAFVLFMYIGYLYWRKSSGLSRQYRRAFEKLTRALSSRDSGEQAADWVRRIGPDFVRFLESYAALPAARNGEVDQLVRRTERWSLRSLAMTERSELFLFEVFEPAALSEYFSACDEGAEERRSELLNGFAVSAGLIDG